jgi:hypothetical protein
MPGERWDHELSPLRFRDSLGLLQRLVCSSCWNGSWCPLPGLHVPSDAYFALAPHVPYSRRLHELWYQLLEIAAFRLEHEIRRCHMHAPCHPRVDGCDV